MNYFVPLMSKVVDSSLWCEPDMVVKVYLTMLAKKDGDNIVRGNAFEIAQWAKKTELEVLEALRVLSSPDTKRVEPQKFDGRRIERTDDGWLILNADKYRELAKTIMRRSYQANWQREKRASEKGKFAPGEAEFTKAIEQRASKSQLDGIVEKNL